MKPNYLHNAQECKVMLSPGTHLDFFGTGFKFARKSTWCVSRWERPILGLPLQKGNIHAK